VSYLASLGFEFQTSHTQWWLMEEISPIKQEKSSHLYLTFLLEFDQLLMFLFVLLLSFPAKHRFIAQVK